MALVRPGSVRPDVHWPYRTFDAIRNAKLRG